MSSSNGRGGAIYIGVKPAFFEKFGSLVEVTSTAVPLDGKYEIKAHEQQPEVQS